MTEQFPGREPDPAAQLHVLFDAQFVSRNRFLRHQLGNVESQNTQATDHTEDDIETDNQLNGIIYEEQLTATGLMFLPNTAMADIVIQDGEKLLAALAAISPNALSERSQEGLDELIFDHLDSIQEVQLLKNFEPVRDTFGMPRRFLEDERFRDMEQYLAYSHPDDKEEVLGIDPALKQSINHLLFFAPGFQAEMERLGIAQHRIDNLSRLRTWEEEGVLLEWAIADEWELFTEPGEFTPVWAYRDWRKPEDFTPLFILLDRVRHKMTARDCFLHFLSSQVIALLTTKITHSEILDQAVQKDPATLQLHQTIARLIEERYQA